MKEQKIKVGITHGDINGISYEVIMKALSDNRMFDICTPIVYGSAKVAAYHRKALNINNFSFNNIKSVNEAHPKRPNLINCVDDNVRVELGKPTEHAGQASLSALENACLDLDDGKIDALVTAPINKFNVYSDNFQFPGHTEYLESKFEGTTLMLMVNDMLRVGVVAGHVPIREVPDYITQERIVNKLKILNNSLKVDFNIRKPKIAVLGLNPHAGDNGVLGNDEKEVIIPAIEKAKAANIIALGPYPSDGFFGSGAFTKFDGILAMYHDQGLIPFKTLTIDGGVNYTAGLNIVRTSPAHGTAYEIAGKNEATPDSFRKAIYMACDIIKARNSYKQLITNPLKSYDISNEPGGVDDVIEE